MHSRTSFPGCSDVSPFTAFFWFFRAGVINISFITLIVPFIRGGKVLGECGFGFRLRNVQKYGIFCFFFSFPVLIFSLIPHESVTIRNRCCDSQRRIPFPTSFCREDIVHFSSAAREKTCDEVRETRGKHQTQVPVSFAASLCCLHSFSLSLPLSVFCISFGSSCFCLS